MSQPTPKKTNFDSPSGRYFVACMNIAKTTGLSFSKAHDIFMSSPRGAELNRAAEKAHQEESSKSGGK